MEVEEIINRAKAEVKLECRTSIFEGNRKLTSDDLKTPQDPEEFTKGYIIEKVFRILNVRYETGEARFDIPGGIRKVDYASKTDNTRFLVEAKPINSDLFEKSKDGAVNQIKDLFLLDKVKKKYSFGVATDGLKWIFINQKGEEIGNFSLKEDFSKIKDFITGKRDVRREKKQAEISKRFYRWYNALLHGGSYKDLAGRTRTIPEDSCLVKSILNVRSEESSEEIAQIITDRLIFIKFLQTKGLIKEDILSYLSSLDEDVLNGKMRQLFFSVLNTDKRNRLDVDPSFSNIPYLNGSLFTMVRAEKINPDYRVRAEILKKVIEFLDTFRFVSEGEEVQESLDPEILGYIFERAMTATDRKGTGAYYTPKYITRYICENTIYPFLLNRINRYLKEEKGYRDTELLNNLDELFTRVSDTTLADINLHIMPKITVCDPACGSGAFLLAAADIIFDIHRRIRDKMGTSSTDIALKKLVLKNSIYGVDINRKGIEITKLRLWLWIADSYDPEGTIEPLPNIEYNIRAGNSLVGYVDISKFRETKVSIDEYIGLETPVMEHIEKREELLSDYKFSSGGKARELKKEIEEIDVKIKQRLDIHLFQEMLGKKIGIDSTKFTKLESFHWGFEFYRVFENNGGGGFSVVIGNPPYVRQETLGELKKILKEYYEVYTSIADLYVYFYERGHKVLQEGGQFGFISSNKFIKSNYGRTLRDFLIDEHHIKQIIDFGELSVFEDAATFPVIFLTENLKPSDLSTIYTPIKSLDFENLEKVVSSEGKEIPESAFSGFTWSLMGEEENRILKKLEDIGETLNEYTGGDIRFGVKTGFNKAYIIDKSTRDLLIKENPKSAEIIKPIIVGNDVRKYKINFKDKYLIWTYIGVDIERYPAIKKHLDKYQAELEKRWDKGNYWWELRACDYYSDFKKPKIVYPDIGITPRFTLDKNNYFIEATAFEIPSNDPYLLSLLNSNLLFFYIKSLTPILGDVKKRGRIRFKTVYLKNLPIRRISFTTPEDERTKLVSELKELYAKSNFPEILSLIDSYLPKDENGSFITEKEKSDVVHDFLAFLAEQMMDLNKKKQSEIKSFHTWLESYLGIKIDDMKVKTQVRAFYGRSFDEYYKILKRSKGKLEREIEGKDVRDTIKEAFDCTMSKLTPLFDGIRGTDGLIDQIVYRLYGLTEEEIDIVESK